MQCHYLQLIISFLISVYLFKINVDAFAVKDRDNSNEAANQQIDDINFNKPYFARNFKCPSKFGAFPDVEDCSWFYICVAGFSRRMPCPPFFHFDKHRRRCLSIMVAVCDKGEEEETTLPEVTETAIPETTVKDPVLCPEISGTFPHSTDCSKYYECTSFVPVLKTCPENELFDGVKKECRPESEVNCGSRDRPTSETTLVTTPLLPESTPSEVTTTLEPTKPEVTTQEPTTPEATTPEPTTPEPTTPLETTTIEEQTPPETDCEEDDLDCIITETGEIPKWFKCPVELGSHRHPSSKKLFIFCINWKPYVKRCGQDLIFSQELRTCVLP